MFLRHEALTQLVLVQVAQVPLQHVPKGVARLPDRFMHIHDAVILGAGPAGITAAVYAARKKMDFLVISLDIGGQAAWSGDIENYTGYQFVSGPELALKFKQHMDAFGIVVRMPEQTLALESDGLYHTVRTDQAVYHTKTVLIATGKRPRPLDVPGETEFKNKGLTYCATCDGPLFREKTVAVIGGGNSALDAALQMVLFSPKVYLINIAAELTGDNIMIEKVQANPAVEVWNNTSVQRIFGDSFVRGIEVKRQGQTAVLPVEGVFVEIGLVPNSSFAAAVAQNQRGEIIVDQENKTNIPGIFAAGDVTTVFEKQIIIACGEGSKALLSAFQYLATHTFPNG